MITRPNIIYARRSKRDLTLDLCLPDGGPAAPLVVWVHGGGWKVGAQRDCKLEWLVPLGYAVASISYRAPGEAKAPAFLDDCFAAINWIRENCAKELDVNRFAICGESSGGHICAMVAAKMTGVFRAAIPFNAVTDIPALVKPPHWHNHDTPESTVGKMLGHPISDDLSHSWEMSPVSQVTNQCPPFLVIAGELDEFVPCTQSAVLHQTLLAAGVKSQFRIIPGMGHNIEHFMEDAVCRDMLVKFLEAHV